MAFGYETSTQSLNSTTETVKDSKNGHYSHDGKRSTQPGGTHQQSKSENNIISSPRLGDVSELFGNECRYSGETAEPIRR